MVVTGGARVHQKNDFGLIGLVVFFFFFAGQATAVERGRGEGRRSEGPCPLVIARVALGLLHGRLQLCKVCVDMGTSCKHGSVWGGGI